MHRGRIARALVAALAAALFALTGAGSAGAAGWGEQVEFPSSGGIGFPEIPAAALDADGGGSVIYRTGIDMVAYTRAGRGDPWTRQSFADFGFDAGAPALAVNAAGDAVAAWTSSDIVLVTYKPAGGSWESPPKSLDDSQQADDVDVAINSAGAVVVAWDGESPGSPAQEEIRAARKSKAGSWPATDAYEVVAEEDDVGAEDFVTQCGGPGAAIDDNGNALLAWSRPYDMFDAGPAIGAGFCAVMTARSSGGAWAAPSALTDTPDVGAGAAPFAGKPAVAADSASGKLTVGFHYSADAWDDGTSTVINDEGWTMAVYGGSVAGGPVAPGFTPTVGAGGQSAVAAGGSNGAATTWAFDGSFDGEYGLYFGSGGGGFGVAALSEWTQPHPQRPPSAAVSANGRSFAGVIDFVLGVQRALFWAQGPGQTVCAARVLLDSGAGDGTAVAADPAGNGLAVAGDESGLYYSEYVEDGSPCGGGAGGGGGGGNEEGGAGGGSGGGAGSTPEAGPPAPPSNKATAGAPKSLANGSVQVTVTFPGPGKVVLRGTAKLETGGGARAAAKKTVVVTRKSAAVKAGKTTFKLAPNAKAKQEIGKRGKLSAKLSITFTPSGGSPATTTKTIVFKQPRKSGK